MCYWAYCLYFANNNNNNNNNNNRKILSYKYHEIEDNIKIYLKSFERAWTGFIWLNVRFCECGNKSSGSVKCGEYD